MTWTPACKVSINDIDYTGNTLETVRVIRGRTEQYAEPRASYVLCELLDIDGSGLPIRPLDRIRITVEDSAAIARPVFTGTITDTSTTLFDSGFESGSRGTITTIIGIGPLARLSRRQVAFAGLPEQGDGDRIAELIDEALSTTWEEASGTWATTGTSSTTWATYDPDVDISLIDQPGQRTVASLDPDVSGYNSLRQAYQAAFSGRGIIWDTPDGYVAYADGDRRRATAIADGYLPIPEAAVNQSGINVISQQADVTNRVVVRYDGGSVVATDIASVGDYGLLVREFDTILANDTQAGAWALDYLEDHSRPTFKLGGVTIRLDGVGDTLRDQLLYLDVNDPVEILGVLGGLPGFVEGIEWRINRLTAELTLNVSDAALSIGSTQWNNVNPTLAWEDVSATLQWINAAEVTA